MISGSAPLLAGSRSNQNNQYQYLHQQQLAHQAYAKQFQKSTHRPEPIGIFQHGQTIDNPDNQVNTSRNHQLRSNYDTTSTPSISSTGNESTLASNLETPVETSFSKANASINPTTNPSLQSSQTDPTSTSSTTQQFHNNNFIKIESQHCSEISESRERISSLSDNLKKQNTISHQFTTESSHRYPHNASSLQASSYFSSTSSRSHFVPNTNGPSSVSSSYKSAVPHDATSHNAFSSYGAGSSFNYRKSSSFQDHSFGNPHGYLHSNQGSLLQQSHWGQQASSVSSNTSPSGIRPSTSPQRDPPIDTHYRAPSISEAQFSQPTSFTTLKQPPAARTSLLTSKLAAAAAATSDLNSNNASLVSGGVTPIKNNSTSSISNSSSMSNFPYPNPRPAVGSLRKQQISPRFSGGTSSAQGYSSFGTTHIASSQGPQNAFSSFMETSENRPQSFLPHPSSTTSNITVATAPGTSTPHPELADSEKKVEEHYDQSELSDSMDTDEDHVNETNSRVLPTNPSVTEDITRGNNGTDQSLNLTRNTGTSHFKQTLPEQLDIANFPVQDVIVMLTALLQKIIDSNDILHSPNYGNTQIHTESFDFTNNSFTANVLAFHGRNIPVIGLQAYLIRILKYCPTTNEVFISLLVYFDRIAQRANAGDFLPTQGQTKGSTVLSGDNNTSSKSSQLFVMDSYNIHRLIITAVTVASKFFSDVFYKNSRYAKVGGLPVEELNHLELQFLLLNDFKLMIPLEELQRYADLLLGFWKKEQAYQNRGQPVQPT